MVMSASRSMRMSPIRRSASFRVAAMIATILAVGAMIAFLATLLSRLVIRPVTDMTGAMEEACSRQSRRYDSG